MTNYLLLIWQGVPETLDLYLIPLSILDVEVLYFDKCNQLLQGSVNSCDEDDALLYVSNWLANNGSEYKCEETKILTLSELQHIEKVIVSGFML